MIRLIGICLVLSGPLAAMAQETPDEEESEREKKVAEARGASRLRAVRAIMQEIHVESTAADEPAPLEFKLDPLLRYNDVTRGILDSCVFRVGTKGRPVALVSAELYGREGDRFLLNHEFLAVHQPKVRMRRDNFVWEPEAPPEGTLKFQELLDAERPAANPRLRLAQMRKLADRFSATEQVGKSLIVLRRMGTPIDRYQPSDKPNADGAIFAYVWGVNPESLLLLETDGQTWSYGWAPLSSAPPEAKLGERVVWQLPAPTDHESKTAGYTSIYRSLAVPEYFDVPDDEPPAKAP